MERLSAGGFMLGTLSCTACSPSGQFIDVYDRTLLSGSKTANFERHQKTAKTVFVAISNWFEVSPFHIVLAGRQFAKQVAYCHLRTDEKAIRFQSILRAR